MRTAPLRPPPPRFPLDVHPLARLHPDGRLELLQPAFPPVGPLALALWRPGEDPPFRVVLGTLAPGWRFSLPPSAIHPPSRSYVVAWLAVGDPAEPI